MIDTDFRESLAALGLGQYYDRLVAEAFDSWAVLTEITETDLDALNVRLGHRRLLQRAISEHQQTRANSSRDSSERSFVPASQHIQSVVAQTAQKKTPRVKRKYVRHPKEDEQAPEKPPTGYVLFSNYIRSHLKDEKHDFPEIAKIVGTKWQALPKDEKDRFLEKSKELKARYLRQLAEYKRTPQYLEHETYLEDFKTKHKNCVVKRRFVSEDHALPEETGNYPRIRNISMPGEQTEGRELHQIQQPSQIIDLTTNRQGHPSLPSPVQSLSPTVLEPKLPPSFGHMRLGSGPTLGSAPLRLPQSPAGDGCRQLPFARTSNRQLPPLMPTLSSSIKSLMCD